MGNLWRPISWEPRALTKLISMPHTHAHTYTNITDTHTHTHTQTHTHTHTNTHTQQKHRHSRHGFDAKRRKKVKNQQAEEKRWVFSFDLKEESDVACLTEKVSSRWQVRYTEKISPQESSCTPLGHGKSVYLRLNEENEKENRGEATRRGIEELYQR